MLFRSLPSSRRQPSRLLGGGGLVEGGGGGGAAERPIARGANRAARRAAARAPKHGRGSSSGGRRCKADGADALPPRCMAAGVAVAVALVGRAGVSLVATAGVC